MLDILLIIFALTVLSLVTTVPGSPARTFVWKIILGALIAGTVITAFAAQ